MLEVLNLSKKYKDHYALKNLKFRLDKGIVGLIGPNGAGKSTFFKILSTLVPPNTGSLKLFDLDVQKQSYECRKKIGILFENPVFPSTLYVFSSLVWVGKARGLSNKEAEKQVLQNLEYFNLSKSSNKKIGQLSAGMKQKYGLILATIGFPPLIILDEPTSNLDVDSRLLFKDFVIDLNSNHGCSFIIASHVLEELESFCDEFLFLIDGEIKKRGTKKELLKELTDKEFSIICEQLPKLIYSELDKEGINFQEISHNEVRVYISEKDFSNHVSFLNELANNEGLAIFPVKKGLREVYSFLRKTNFKK